MCLHPHQNRHVLSNKGTHRVPDENNPVLHISLQNGIYRMNKPFARFFHVIKYNHHIFAKVFIIALEFGLGGGHYPGRWEFRDPWGCMVRDERDNVDLVR